MIEKELTGKRIAQARRALGLNQSQTGPAAGGEFALYLLSADLPQRKRRRCAACFGVSGGIYVFSSTYTCTRDVMMETVVLRSLSPEKYASASSRTISSTVAS